MEKKGTVVNGNDGKRLQLTETDQRESSLLPLWPGLYKCSLLHLTARITHYQSWEYQTSPDRHQSTTPTVWVSSKLVWIYSFLLNGLLSSAPCLICFLGEISASVSGWIFIYSKGNNKVVGLNVPDISDFTENSNKAYLFARKRRKLEDLTYVTHFKYRWKCVCDSYNHLLSWMRVKSMDLTSSEETRIIICFANSCSFISSECQCNKYFVESKCVRFSKGFSVLWCNHVQLQQLEVQWFLSGPVQLLKKKCDIFISQSFPKWLLWPCAAHICGAHLRHN